MPWNATEHSGFFRNNKMCCTKFTYAHKPLVKYQLTQDLSPQGRWVDRGWTGGRDRAGELAQRIQGDWRGCLFLRFPRGLPCQPHLPACSPPWASLVLSWVSRPSVTLGGHSATSVFSRVPHIIHILPKYGKGWILSEARDGGPHSG